MVGVSMRSGIFVKQFLVWSKLFIFCLFQNCLNLHLAQNVPIKVILFDVQTGLTRKIFGQRCLDEGFHLHCCLFLLDMEVPLEMVGSQGHLTNSHY
jgi:hypothetical protein